MTQGLIPITPDILDVLVAAIPARLRMVMEKSYINFHWIGGGFLRDTLAGLPHKDIDMFSRYPGNTNMLEALAYPGCQQHSSPQSTSIDVDGHLVSFIKHPVLMPDIMKFDFTCCALAIACGNGEWSGFMAENALADIKARRLTYTGKSLFPDESGAGSVIRAFRLQKKGWEIDQESILAMCKKVAGSGVNGMNITKCVPQS